MIQKNCITCDQGILSPFWKDITKDRFLIDIGTNWQVGNDHTVKFWLDRWTGHCALSAIYPNFFLIAYDQHILVSQVFRDNGIHLHFAKKFTGIYHTEWCTVT